MTEAAKLANVSRRTIQCQVKSGKLSVTKDRHDNPLVDTAELARVFDKLVTPKETEKSQPVVTLESLQEQIELLTKKVDEQHQEIITMSHRLASPSQDRGETPREARKPPQPKKKTKKRRLLEAKNHLLAVRARQAKTKTPIDTPIEILREIMKERREELASAEEAVEMISVEN